MRRSRKTAAHSGPADLNAAFELLAASIGDDIGKKLAQAIGGDPSPRRLPRSPRPKAICASEGCGRFVAAKGLCKSHYNLMLYHRRKDAAGRSKKRPRELRDSQQG